MNSPHPSESEKVAKDIAAKVSEYIGPDLEVGLGMDIKAALDHLAEEKDREIAGLKEEMRVRWVLFLSVKAGMDDIRLENERLGKVIMEHGEKNAEFWADGYNTRHMKKLEDKIVTQDATITRLKKQLHAAVYGGNIDTKEVNELLKDFEI